jgi:hypothetical protein
MSISISEVGRRPTSGPECPRCLAPLPENKSHRCNTSLAILSFCECFDDGTTREHPYDFPLKREHQQTSLGLSVQMLEEGRQCCGSAVLPTIW